MPWDEERRRAVKRRLDKEAERAKARTGARTVALIAFYDDGSPSLIMIEGGTAPMPGGQLYAALAQLYAENEAKLAAQAKGQPAATAPEPTTQQ